MMYFSRRLRQFRAANKGISAVEFALIAPLMILIYFACIELSFMMVLDRKVTSSAAALGDLVARASTIDDDDLADVFEATRMIFQPNPIAEARMRISSLYDDEGTIKVAWSDGYNMVAYSEDQVKVVPDDLVPAGGSVIYAEIEYDYESTLGYLFTTKKTLSDEFYLRPRRTDFVARVRD
ncbi:TadE/TadG family type IV pilus assembly protein [Henriciella pelagia]|jgi:Flp pilus assembly protein TadG|uniref:Pilus biosynthesis protein TadE n=1 Tax=Henriciella pelagia TaxID=1977912 RepID=A0ABQ1JM20_9PROT|nr:TadE/TadG family type IV pilus assembly protein [Henriciella pelagia]GGB70444.1 pilus biosynthesis protein TadE [Henriciella pelagia]